MASTEASVDLPVPGAPARIQAVPGCGFTLWPSTMTEQGSRRAVRWPSAHARDVPARRRWPSGARGDQRRWPRRRLRHRWRALPSTPRVQPRSPEDDQIASASGHGSSGAKARPCRGGADRGWMAPWCSRLQPPPSPAAMPTSGAGDQSRPTVTTPGTSAPGTEIAHSRSSHSRSSLGPSTRRCALRSASCTCRRPCISASRTLRSLSTATS